MNLGAYENEANECDGISAQQKQGFAALNTGRKKGKYHVPQFCLRKNSVFMFNFSWPHCSCSWKRGMLQKRGTRNKHGGRENIKKGTKEWIGNIMKSLSGIGFNLVFVPYRIARKLGQDTAPCSKKMPDKAEISEVPSRKLLGVAFDRNMVYDSHVDDLRKKM